MKCEKCHVNEATVFLTQTHNGKTTEMHLCDSCAKESESILFDDGIAFQQFLSGLLDSGKHNQTKSNAITCEQCGMTLNMFKKNSLVGCSNCYHTFNLYLEPIIKRIQSNSLHTGKTPSNADDSRKIKDLITKYERELKIALMEENYEQAAVLRDKIKDLKGDDEL